MTSTLRTKLCVGAALVLALHGCSDDDGVPDSGFDALSDMVTDDSSGNADTSSDFTDPGMDASQDTSDAIGADTTFSDASSDASDDLSDGTPTDAADAEADSDSNGVTGAWADGTLTTAELFDGNLIDTIVFEVDYEEGAEPVNGSGALNWDYVRANAERLFDVSGATVSLPTGLDELDPLIIDESFGDSYSSAEIIQISEANTDEPETGTRAPFHVLFLNGFFESDGSAQENVLGVSIGRQRLIALFKPSLDTVPALTSAQRGYVEETTLVHEIGHAVGLVNLPGGVPMVEDHEDPNHLGHDIDEDCIMYWRNERASDALGFVLSQVIGSSDRILFCEPSLDDVDAFSIAPTAD